MVHSLKISLKIDFWDFQDFFQATVWFSLKKILRCKQGTGTTGDEADEI
jgi:hypothetical protein